MAKHIAELYIAKNVNRIKMKKLIIVLLLIFLVGCAKPTPDKQPSIITPIGHAIKIEAIPSQSFNSSDATRIDTDQKTIFVNGFVSLSIGDNLEIVSDGYCDFYLCGVAGVRVVGTNEVWLLK